MESALRIGRRTKTTTTTTHPLFSIFMRMPISVVWGLLLTTIISLQAQDKNIVSNSSSSSSSMVEAFSVNTRHHRRVVAARRSSLAITGPLQRTIPGGAGSSHLYVSTTSTASPTTNNDNDGEDDELSLESLIDMDVVIYSSNTTSDESSSSSETNAFLLGAIQEDGSLAPLSAWTTEPAFGDSLEFLVDEDDRFSLSTSTSSTNNPAGFRLHYRLTESELSYGSRQCHRGVGNPHGEESELLYYVEQSIIDKFGIQIALKPDLEILW
jgi:hypothetical protein